MVGAFAGLVGVRRCLGGVERSRLGLRGLGRGTQIDYPETVLIEGVLARGEGYVVSTPEMVFR